MQNDYNRQIRNQCKCQVIFMSKHYTKNVVDVLNDINFLCRKLWTSQPEYQRVADARETLLIKDEWFNMYIKCVYKIRNRQYHCFYLIN